MVDLLSLIVFIALQMLLWKHERAIIDAQIVVGFIKMLKKKCLKHKSFAKWNNGGNEFLKTYRALRPQ